MSEIKLDDSKIQSYVIPNFNYTKIYLQRAYQISSSLKNALPSDYYHSNDIKVINNSLQTVEQDVGTLNKKVADKIETAKMIEVKHRNQIKSLTSDLLSNSSNVGTGTISTSKTTSSVKTEAKPKDTGAKESKSGTESLLSKIGKKISDGLSGIGAKISSAFDSVVDWGKGVLEDTKAIFTKIGDGFKAAWDWITNGDNWAKIGASIANAVISFVKGAVSLIESIGDFIIIASAAIGTPGACLSDILTGITTGNWDFKTTKGLWDETKSVVSYEWTNKIFADFYNTDIGKTLDNYAFKPFKSDGMMCEVLEGAGYIAGIVAISIATFGTGTAVMTVGGSSSTLITVGAAATEVTGAMATVTTSTLAMGTIATAGGIGKNTSKAWNDGAGILDGLQYGTAKGLWEGTSMAFGHTVNTLKVLKGAGVARQIFNSGTHVIIDAFTGAGNALIDPAFSTFYTPDPENLEQLLYTINYDKEGNKISDKTWDDLSPTEKYRALFNYRGGWKTVGTKALSAGIVSAVSELPSIGATAWGSSVLKKVDNNGLNDDTLKSISHLKSKGIVAYVEQAEMLGKLDLAAKGLTAAQFNYLARSINATTFKNVVNSATEDQLKDIAKSSGKTAYKVLGSLTYKKISNLSDDAFTQVGKFLNDNQIANLSTSQLKLLAENFDSLKMSKLSNESLKRIIGTMKMPQLTEKLETLKGDSLRRFLEQTDISQVRRLLSSTQDADYSKLVNNLSVEKIAELADGYLSSKQMTRLFNGITDNSKLRQLITSGVISFNDGLSNNVKKQIYKSMDATNFDFFQGYRASTRGKNVISTAPLLSSSYKIKDTSWLQDPSDFKDFLKDKFGLIGPISLKKFTKVGSKINGNIYSVIEEYIKSRNNGDLKATIEELLKSFEPNS